MQGIKISKSITRRNSASLSLYFQEISKKPLLNQEEEVRLVKRIREGDPRAMETLVNANLRFVVSVAKQYQHRGLGLPDLISEGNLGLIKAIERFDETRGFKFISYAVWWIRQSIFQALYTQASIIRIPMNKIGDAGKVKKAILQFQQKNEREPTSLELSRALHCSPEKIGSIVNIPGQILSLDEGFGNNPRNSSLLDQLANPDASSAEDYINKDSLKTDIKTVLSSLSKEERNIVSMSFGIGAKRELSLDEIGHRYNLTKERIRQIKVRAMNKLQKAKNTLLKYSYMHDDSMSYRYRKREAILT